MRDVTSKRQRLEILRAQLHQERSSFLSHWRELSDFILPRRSRFFTDDVNRGDKRNNKIIDSTATFASRTLAAGMMSGVTSPARPWFRLSTESFQLNEVQAVKQWLQVVEERMRAIFLKSNLYKVLPTLYGDMGTFATSALFMEEDLNDSVRFYNLPIGSYYLGLDEKLRPRFYWRDYQMTIHQIIEKFARDPETNEINWDILSSHVKWLHDSGNDQARLDISHVVFPNPDYDPNRLESKFKRFASVYYERGISSTQSDANYLTTEYDKFLRQSGFDYFPVLAPRWEVTGEDTYGTMSPGMMVLGDIKMLQTGERRIMQAVEKMVNPPMVGPSSLRNQKASILPGDITILDIQNGQQGFEPAHEVNPRIQEMEVKQAQVRERINRAYHSDLFLMLANSDRRQITATEILERREEKLLALGPVLEQLNQDLLDPLIDNTFSIMLKQGLVPDPPEELEGQDLKIEYISVMHQAQKTASLGSIERAAGFFGNLAQFDPKVLDKINMDQMVDRYADVISLPPDLIRSDDEVAETRAARAKAQQQMQQVEMAKQAASAAKDLGNTPIDENSALGRMTQASQAGALV